MERFPSRVALWIACVLCALFVPVSAAEASGPPTVTVLRISGVTPTSVTLNADVRFNGLPTGGGFEYGLDTQYGSSIGFASDPGMTEGIEMSFPIGGLTTGKLYHYRASASNSAGTVNSED